MIKQLGKFSPKIAQMSHPLRELLSAKRVWIWGPSQDDVFLKLKHKLTTPGILVHYNPDSETKVSDDASLDFESRYAQIEKEVLAAMRAFEKFASYIFNVGH